MDKKAMISEKKARQEYFTNQLLINTIEWLGVSLLLFIFYKWMNTTNFITWIYPYFKIMLVAAVLGTGWFGFLFYRGDRKMGLHFALSISQIVVWGIIYYGFSSPYGLKSYYIALAVSVIYFYGAYAALFWLSARKPKARQPIQ